MIVGVFVYTSLLFFMLLCFAMTQQLSPYRNNLSPDQKKNSLAYFTYCILFALPLLAFSVVFGIRYGVGFDHVNYLNIYLYGYKWRQDEPIFVMIQNFFAINEFPYPYYFGFLSFLQVFLFFMAFRKDPKLLVWLVVFLFFDGLLGSWNNIIRTAIAGCIWIFSIDFIVEKKLIPYLVCSLLAIGFHYSSVTLVIAYPLFYKGVDFFGNMKLQYILLAVAFVLRFSFSSFAGMFETIINIFSSISVKYEYYTAEKILQGGKEALQTGTSLAFYFVILVNIVIIAYSHKMHKYFNSRKFNIVYNIYFIGVLLFYVFPLGYVSLTRPFRYLYFFRSIMLAYFALYLFENRKQLKEFATLMVLLVAFAGIFYGPMLNDDNKERVPYETFMQHPEVPTHPMYKPRSLFKN